MKTLNVAFGVCALIVHIRSIHLFSRHCLKSPILNLQCNSNGRILLEPDDLHPKPVHGSHPPLLLHTGDLTCRTLHHKLHRLHEREAIEIRFV